jgi:hypothetical protein
MSINSVHGHPLVDVKVFITDNLCHFIPINTGHYFLLSVFTLVAVNLKALPVMSSVCMFLLLMLLHA